jgi:CRP-like cAMP-binding protein
MLLATARTARQPIPSTFVPTVASKAGRLPAENDPCFAALQPIGMVAHFARNTTIFSDGGEASYSYRLLSGTVRLCKLTSGGRRQITQFLTPGDFFGFEPLQTHSLSAEALTDVEVIRYSRSRLDRLSTVRLDVQRGLTNVLSRGLSAARDHLLILGQHTAQERVVSFFLALAERNGAVNGDVLHLPMGRQDIADYLGLTIETVCRAISELKRRHLIDIPDRTHVTVRNLEALRESAEREF